MLTALLFAAVLAAAPEAVDPSAASPPQSPAASRNAPAGELEPAGSLSEDDLAAEAARVTGQPKDDPADPARGGAELAQQPSIPLDRSRIENFTPPPAQPVAAPSLGGFGFAAAFGR